MQESEDRRGKQASKPRWSKHRAIPQYSVSELRVLGQASHGALNSVIQGGGEGWLAGTGGEGREEVGAQTDKGGGEQEGYKQWRKDLLERDFS